WERSINMSDKILVVGEAKDGELRNVSFEVIAAAKQIKEDAEIVALLLGEEGLDAYANEMIQYGADRAITVSHANLKEYTSEGYGQELLEVIKEEEPCGVMMGPTSEGQGVTPKVASRMAIGLISDVTDIEPDGDNRVFVRPIYSGKASEKKVMYGGLVCATNRPNNIASLEKDEART